MLGAPWLLAVSLVSASTRPGLLPCVPSSPDTDPVTLDLGPTLAEHDLILTNHIRKDYFQLRSYAKVPGGREFGGDAIQPTAEGK